MSYRKLTRTCKDLLEDRAKKEESTEFRMFTTCFIPYYSKISRLRSKYNRSSPWSPFVITKAIMSLRCIESSYLHQ
jgi:hypothetical protein